MSQALLDAAPYGSTVELGVHSTATPLVVPAGVALANSYIKATGTVNKLITVRPGGRVLNVGVDGNGQTINRIIDSPDARGVRIDGVDTINEGNADVFYFTNARNSKLTNCTSKTGWNIVTLRGNVSRMKVRDIEVERYKQRVVYGITSSTFGSRHVSVDGIDIGLPEEWNNTSKQPIAFQAPQGYHRYLNISRVNIEGKFQGGSQPGGRFGRDPTGNTADAISVHRGLDGSIKSCNIHDTGEIGINVSWNTKNFDVSGNTVIRSQLTGISCGVNTNGPAELVNNIDVHSNTLIDNGQMLNDARDYERYSANLWFENAQDCSAMANMIVQTRGNTRWGIRTNNVRRIDLYNYFRGFAAANEHRNT